MNILYSLKSINLALKALEPSKAVLVVPSALSKNLAWAIKEVKKNSPLKMATLLIRDGEKSKNFESVQKLLNKFAKLKLDKKSVIIAIGGGATTDAVGFASSIYQRGISNINVPTTLLAQVDAAIGGKTAINFNKHKNQIGTFHEAKYTIVDTRFLKTLSQKQINDGLAEIIKSGLIHDKSILELLSKNGKIMFTKEALSKKIINKTIAVKKYFVQKDFYDKNIRQILNFGHTIGHALELRYDLSHGEAVLAGMLQELKIGEKLKITNPEITNYYKKLLKKLEIEIKPQRLSWKEILHDKKITGGIVTIPIIKKLGEAKLIQIRLDKLKSLV